MPDGEAASGRDRMKAALADRSAIRPRQRPDAVPFGPCYLGLYLHDRFQENYVAAYKQRLAGRQGVRVNLELDNEIRLAARLKAQAIFREPHDWMWLMSGQTHSWAANTELVAQGEKAFWRDARNGKTWELAPAPGGCKTDTWTSQVRLESRRDVEALCPLPKSEDWRRGSQSGGAAPGRPGGPLAPPPQLPRARKARPSELAGGAYDLMKLMVARLGPETFMCGAVGTPFWGCYGHLGFEGLMCAVAEKPALLEHMLERRTAWCLEYAKVLAAVGAHGVWIEECFTGADILSPPQFRRFVMPYTRQVIDALRRMGMIGIYYVCGDVMPQLGAIMEMAPDVLAVEESKKGFGIDVAEIRRRVGNTMALLGNFDAMYLLEHGSPQEMEREVRRQIDACARDGGFAMCMGSPMTLTTPPERLDLLAALTKKWGFRNGKEGRG